MFGKSLSLFSLFGIEVKVNLGWALIATFIAFSLAQGLFPSIYEGLAASTYWAMAFVALIGLAASIVLHELAHSLVARGFGMPVRSITLFMFGGVAQLERDPPSPIAEFWVAIAGPAMSFALAGVLIVAAGVDGLNDNVAAVLSYLGMLNVILAVFNLIPAFPMDGGRALRAALWSWRRDKVWATRIASRLGGFFGLALMGAGLFFVLNGAVTGGLWWILIGAFVRSAAMSAMAEVASEGAFAGRPVSAFMSAPVDTATPEQSLRRFVDDLLYRRHHDLFPVVQNGAVVGVIGQREVRAVQAEDWDTTTVAKAMRPVLDVETVEARADAAETLAHMQRHGVTRLLVFDHGRLAGVVALKDFLSVVSLRMSLER